MTDAAWLARDPTLRERSMRVVRCAMLSAVVAGLCGVVAPVGWAGADEGGAGAAGQAREYRLVYVDGRKPGGKQKVVALPPVPVGVSYQRGSFGVAEPWGVFGVLLRSDGKLVGFGSEGRRLVTQFEARYSGQTVVDMTIRYPAHATVLFSNGRQGGLPPTFDDTWQDKVGPGEPVVFTKYLDSELGSTRLLADGRAASWPSEIRMDVTDEHLIPWSFS
ncbi:MAG: hypothetical protein FWD59_05345, partial [Micrococcales bacterium]|nr:hypothetical protein [Micrococcales bacterium]